MNLFAEVLTLIFFKLRQVPGRLYPIELYYLPVKEYDEYTAEKKKAKIDAAPYLNVSFLTTDRLIVLLKIPLVWIGKKILFFCHTAEHLSFLDYLK